MLDAPCFAYLYNRIDHKFKPHVSKYAIHGASGYIKLTCFIHSSMESPKIDGNWWQTGGKQILRSRDMDHAKERQTY